MNQLNVAIIGGDERQYFLIKKLEQLDLKLILIGLDELNIQIDNGEKLKIDEVKWSEIDGIILPVGGTHVDGTIASIYSNEKIILKKEHLQQTPNHCTIFSGLINSYIKEVTEQTNRKVVNVFEKEDIAVLNSIPTAEGVIQYAMAHTNFTIHGSNIIVLGFGRVGKTVARKLQALGANVYVGVRKEEKMGRIVEMEMTPFHLNHIGEVIRKTDICINTIPALIVTEQVITNMEKHTLIIDVASRPGGTDFESAKKNGIKAIHALGLPGKVAPKTAGEILGKALSRLLADLNKSKQ